MPLSIRQARRREAIIAEAIREVGILFLAFAPLDLAFASEPASAVVAALNFTLTGLLLFVFGLRMEVRRD